MIIEVKCFHFATSASGKSQTNTKNFYRKFQTFMQMKRKTCKKYTKKVHKSLVLCHAFFHISYFFTYKNYFILFLGILNTSHTEKKNHICCSWFLHKIEKTQEKQSSSLQKRYEKNAQKYLAEIEGMREGGFFFLSRTIVHFKLKNVFFE